MKVIHVLILAIGLFLIPACGPASESGDTETTAPPTTDTPTSTSLGTQGPAYSITVLDPDKPSPRKEMKGTIGQTTVVVNYGSPSVKGRKIWGGLEPLGAVWRSGANEATSIEFSTDVLIEGQALPAGKYGLFTIPNENNWVVIFNENWEQWGDYDYDKEKDVLRVEIQAETKEENREQLDYLIDNNKVALRWEFVNVPFSVQENVN